MRPFLSGKYDLTKHPNYKYTAGANPKYKFEIEEYLERCRRSQRPGTLTLYPDDSYIVTDATQEDGSA